MGRADGAAFDSPHHHRCRHAGRLSDGAARRRRTIPTRRAAVPDKSDTHLVRVRQRGPPPLRKIDLAQFAPALEDPTMTTPSPLPPSRRRLRRALGASVVIAGLAVALFDWNMLRGPIGSLVSARLERGFRIAGDLRVQPWSLQPTFSAERIELDNARWGKASRLARIGRLQFSVDLRRLIHGEWVLPEVIIDQPDIRLEDNGEGVGNWVMGGRSDGTGPALRVGSLRIRDGLVNAMLPSRRTDVRVTVATEAASGRLRFAAEGRWQGQALRLEGHAGNLLELEHSARPYPVAALGEVGATRFSIDGTVTNLLALAGLDVGFSLAGRSLAELYPLTGVPLPATPPYRLAARLTHAGQQWTFTGIDGRIGSSDVSGTFAVDRRPTPQRLTGALRSRRLDLADLSGFIGARNEAGQPLPPPRGKVLPARPLGVGKIAAANVDLDFAIADIRNVDLPLDSASGHLRIDERRVTVAPLKVGLAHGQVDGRLELDARAKPAAARLDVQASRLRLRDLMPAPDSRVLTTGTLGGRAKLTMRGDSVAQLLGSADGDLALAMNGGSTNRLLIRLANLDVANAVVAWLASGQKEDIRCLVGDFSARQGVLSPRTLLLDTERMLIRGEGEISLKDERLDLHLRAAAKDGSLLALRGPLHLTGTFASPSVTPEPVPLGARIASAVALGLLSPPLALLPLVELGGAEDSACGDMLARVGRRTGVRP